MCIRDRMALDPRKRNLARTIERQREELFPQVTVGDRLALGVLPLAPKPAHVPLVLKALDHVGRIAHDLDGSLGVLTQCFNNRADFHPLIRRVRVAAARVLLVPTSPRPTARSRVTAARAVGMNSFHIRRVIQASGSVENLVTAGGRSPRSTCPRVTCSSTSRNVPRTATHTTWRCVA